MTIDDLRAAGAGALNLVSEADRRIDAAERELAAALEARRAAVQRVAELNFRIERAGGSAVERFCV